MSAVNGLSITKARAELLEAVKAGRVSRRRTVKLTRASGGKYDLWETGDGRRLRPTKRMKELADARLVRLLPARSTSFYTPRDYVLTEDGESALATYRRLTDKAPRSQR